MSTNSPATLGTSTASEWLRLAEGRTDSPIPSLVARTETAAAAVSDLLNQFGLSIAKYLSLSELLAGGTELQLVLRHQHGETPLAVSLSENRYEVRSIDRLDQRPTIRSSVVDLAMMSAGRLDPRKALLTGQLVLEGFTKERVSISEDNYSSAGMPRSSSMWGSGSRPRALP